MRNLNDRYWLWKIRIPAEFKHLPIDERGLPGKCVALLRSLKFEKLGDLEGMSSQQLLSIPKFGKTSLSALFYSIATQISAALPPNTTSTNEILKSWEQDRDAKAQSPPMVELKAPEPTAAVAEENPVEPPTNQIALVKSEELSDSEPFEDDRMFKIPTALRDQEIDLSRMSKRNLKLIQTIGFTKLGEFHGLSASRLLKNENFGRRSLSQLVSEVERQCGGLSATSSTSYLKLPEGFVTFPRLIGMLINEWNQPQYPESLVQLIGWAEKSKIDSDLHRELDRIRAELCPDLNTSEQGGVLEFDLNKEVGELYLSRGDKKYSDSLSIEPDTYFNSFRKLCDILLRTLQYPPNLDRISTEIEIKLRLGDETYRSGIGTQTCPILNKELNYLEDLFEAFSENEITRSVLLARLLTEKSNRATLQELGDRHNVTRERIRQIESRSAEKLKRSIQTTANREIPALEIALRKANGLLCMEDLQKNIYFANYFCAEKFGPTFYFSLLAIGSDEEITIDKGLIGTPDGYKSAEGFKAEIRKILKMSDRVLISITELVALSGASRAQALFVADSLSCSIENGYVVNDLAKTASNRSRIYQVLLEAKTPLTAKEIAERLNSQFKNEEPVSPGRISAVCGSLPDIAILDWGVYAHSSILNFTPDEIERWTSICHKILSQEQKILSLNDLLTRLESKADTMGKLTPLLLGGLLGKNPKFAKVGRLRIGLAGHTDDGAGTTLIESAVEYLNEAGKPVLFSKIEKYLVEEKGYSVHSPDMTLPNAREIYHFSGGRIGLKEQGGVSETELNSLTARGSEVLRKSEFKLLGLDNLAKQINVPSGVDPIFLGSSLAKTADVQFDRRRGFAWIEEFYKSPIMNCLLQKWMEQNKLTEITPRLFMSFLSTLGIEIPKPSLYQLFATADFLTPLGDGRYKNSA